MPLSLDAEDFGRTFLWTLGDTQQAEFTYLDLAGLPWRVGHLRADLSGDAVIITWTARGADLPNNWLLPESEIDLSFRVEAYSNDALVLQAEQTETMLSITPGQADTLRVAAISADGRVGEWGSIPLPPA